MLVVMPFTEVLERVRLLDRANVKPQCTNDYLVLLQAYANARRDRSRISLNRLVRKILRNRTIACVHRSVRSPVPAGFAGALQSAFDTFAARIDKFMR